MTESKPIFTGPNSFLDCMNHEYMIQKYPDENTRKQACTLETNQRTKYTAGVIANIPTRSDSALGSN